MDYSSLENMLRNADWSERKIKESIDKQKELEQAVQSLTESKEWQESRNRDLQSFISTMELIGIKVPENTNEENIWGVLEAQCSSEV